MCVVTPSGVGGERERCDSSSVLEKHCQNECLSLNMERKMFYGAKPDIFFKAKWLRENMTEAEKLLWKQLNKNKLGVRFKPQHPIDIYIVDFYCHALNLAIELDGESHRNSKEYDQDRTCELENFGIRVIRFNNSEVFQNINKVMAQINYVIRECRIDKDST